MTTATTTLFQSIMAKALLGTLSILSCSVYGAISESRQSIPTSGQTHKVVLNNIKPQCPLNTHAEWQAFLQEHAHHDHWAKSCEQDCDQINYRYVKANIERILTDCAFEIHSDPTIARCTDHLRQFIPNWLRLNNPDSYGFQDGNREYHLDQDGPDKPPGMMSVPPEITLALPERAAVERVAREQGWKYLTHVSAIRATRTFIFIPDASGRFDRWILINYEHDPDRVGTSSEVAFIAVQKQDITGQPLAAFPLRFRNYHVIQEASGYTLSLEDHFSGKCFACHPSGVRRLVDIVTPATVAQPVRGEPGFDPSGAVATSPGFARQRLNEFNAILSGYGMPDWQGQVTPEALGPALGSGQGCTACHNNERRGALSIFTSVPHIEHKILDELSMPPQPGLTRLVEKYLMNYGDMSVQDLAALDAGVQLHGQVSREFFAARLPTLVNWLLQEACK